MSPKALWEAKPDRVETSAIAALAGFAFGDALLVCKAIPTRIPAPVLCVVVLCTNGFDLRRRRGFLLLFLDVGQHSAEMLVLGDCCVCNPLLMRVEDAAGQGNAFGTHLDAPVRHLVDIDVCADQATRQVIDLQPDALAVVLQRQVLGDIAFVAETKDFREAIRFDVQSAMQVVWFGRSLCKLGVVAFNEAH